MEAYARACHNKANGRCWSATDTGQTLYRACEHLQERAAKHEHVRPRGRNHGARASHKGLWRSPGHGAQGRGVPPINCQRQFPKTCGTHAESVNDNRASRHRQRRSTRLYAQHTDERTARACTRSLHQTIHRHMGLAAIESGYEQWRLVLTDTEQGNLHNARKHSGETLQRTRFAVRLVGHDGAAKAAPVNGQRLL